jgi:hypothetical protein
LNKEECGEVYVSKEVVTSASTSLTLMVRFVSQHRLHFGWKSSILFERKPNQGVNDGRETLKKKPLTNSLKTNEQIPFTDILDYLAHGSINGFTDTRRMKNSIWYNGGSQ